MAIAILYYSYGGSTRTYCKWLAKDVGADLYEVVEPKRRNPVSVMLFGTDQAKKGRASKIIMPEIDWDEYEDIVIAGPIWNANPAPAVNAIIDRLPPRKNVTLILVSTAGTYVAEYAQGLIRKKGCTVSEVLSLKREEALLEK
jgi:flavodoxin